MQYQLLASDFDNTLVPFGEPKPHPAVVRAVKKMQAAGGRFVLSTGRGYCVVSKEQLGGIRFDYAITCNGACVVDKNGTVVAEHPLTNEEMYALVDFCEDYNYPLQFNFRDGGSTKSTATSAFTSCRRAASAETAGAATTSCAAAWIRAWGFRTCARRWA